LEAPIRQFSSASPAGKSFIPPHPWARRALELTLAIGIPVALVGLYQLATSQRWIDPRLIDARRDGSNTRDLWNSGQLWDASTSVASGR